MSVTEELAERTGTADTPGLDDPELQTQPAPTAGQPPELRMGSETDRRLRRYSGMADALRDTAKEIANLGLDPAAARRSVQTLAGRFETVRAVVRSSVTGTVADDMDTLVPPIDGTDTSVVDVFVAAANLAMFLDMHLQSDLYVHNRTQLQHEMDRIADRDSKAATPAAVSGTTPDDLSKGHGTYL